MCSHDPFFRTNKESSIWRQNDHAKFVGAFHLSRRVSDKNRACSISIRFLKIKDPFDGRSFLMCSHDPLFGTNKNRILKNGSCERAFILEIRAKEHNIFLIHSVRCTINCALEKLFVFPVFETFIITPCRIYGKYDCAKCYYQMISH